MFYIKFDDGKSKSNKDKLNLIAIAQFMPESQMLKFTYQGSIIWTHRKATLKKKILEDLYQLFNIFESLSLSFIKTIHIS